METSSSSEYYALDYEDKVGDVKTRFHYAKVPAESFNLTPEVERFRRHLGVMEPRLDVADLVLVVEGVVFVDELGRQRRRRRTRRARRANAETATTTVSRPS
jgi:hypothetical protein